MYYVKITKISDLGSVQEQIIKIKTEKFYELVGRFTLKMGPPEKIQTIDPTIQELCFYQDVDNEVTYVTVEYVKVGMVGEINNTTTTNTVPIVEPTEDKSIVDSRLNKMLNDGCLKIA